MIALLKVGDDHVVFVVEQNSSQFMVVLNKEQAGELGGKLVEFANGGAGPEYGSLELN